jgi:hypothetical protein
MVPVQLHWSSDSQLVYQGEDVNQNSRPQKFMRYVSITKYFPRYSSIGQQREKTIFRGFSHLSFATLYALFKSKIAGREAARQRVVTTAWELEESERFTTFLNGVYDENKTRLLFNDEELKQIRNVFSDRSQEQIDDDTNYLQAVYDDECEILRAVAAQAEVLSKHLGLQIKEDVLGSTGEPSHSPQFVGKSRPSSDIDDSMDDDEDTDDDEEDDDFDIDG